MNIFTETSDMIGRSRVHSSSFSEKKERKKKSVHVLREKSHLLFPLLIKQSGLQVQRHGIQLMIKSKKQFQLTIFGNLFKSLLTDINE